MNKTQQTAPVRHTHTAIIGAGPIGLETAYELQQAGQRDHIIFDRGSLGSTISWFPQGMSFFSSTDRIAITNIPIQTTDQTKATKEQYLAHLRTVALAHNLNIKPYTPVTSIQLNENPNASSGSPRFTIHTVPQAGPTTYTADHIVLATGDMHHPRLINIPGESLPHVSHYFNHPHEYFGRKLLIVGGKNSAVEAALRCYHAGANVTISHRRADFIERSVKYWLLPELLGRIKRKEITLHAPTQPVEINPTHTTLKNLTDNTTQQIEADAVLLLTGYTADMSLFESAGVTLQGPNNQTPTFDPQTMQTNIPHLYTAGTATAGTQAQGYKLFIENCHIHAKRIAAHITKTQPPGPDPIFEQPES